MARYVYRYIVAHWWCLFAVIANWHRRFCSPSLTTENIYETNNNIYMTNNELRIVAPAVSRLLPCFWWSLWPSSVSHSPPNPSWAVVEAVTATAVAAAAASTVARVIYNTAFYSLAIGYRIIQMYAKKKKKYTYNETPSLFLFHSLTRSVAGIISLSLSPVRPVPSRSFASSCSFSLSLALLYIYLMSPYCRWNSEITFQ